MKSHKQLYGHNWKQGGQEISRGTGMTVQEFLKELKDICEKCGKGRVVLDEAKNK